MQIEGLQQNDRRALSRPRQSDRRVCPSCAGIAIFLEGLALLRPDGSREPGWICESGGCGYRIFVRGGTAKHGAHTALDPATRGLALLVADLLIRNRYREALRAAGYATAEPDGGVELFAEVAAHRPTLIVLTSNAPGVDAATFCESVSADRSVTGVRLAVLTQPPHQPAINARLRAIGVRLIRMPCTPARLQHLVSEDPPGSGTWRRTGARFATQTIRTTTPPKAPPQCWCPGCGLTLEYELSYIGGIPGRSPSQWDYFRCAQCGQFCYRHGTHRSALRAVAEEVTRTRGMTRGQR